jgi:hypothetical protein
VNFRIEYKIRANKPKNEITTVVYVFMVDTSRNIELIKEGVRATFKVEPFDTVVKSIDDHEMKVTAPALIDTFLNVSIGAIRGILAKDLKGSPLSGMVLPLIPIQGIRENSMKDEKSEG